MKMSLITIRYISFALIATAANLGVQRLTLMIDNSNQFFLLAMIFGTFSGLIIKYFLDKRWIFFDFTSGLRVHTKKFSLYVIMGIMTTIIFWGTEAFFWFTYKTQLMREFGALVGLAIGYFIKFQLDSRYVFKNFNLDNIK
ncbi:MAG: polysaccharide biosynthesis protein GtrA [Rhodospirillaceae bacterium]|nr:polysaccharide biosynthesis protein GtrA [Rhodospirillaceae bacterium]|tara:strand:+ start:807 stop:1229 length:423 start_codon:yes stop_codon:yes gene_type:complete